MKTMGLASFDVRLKPYLRGRWVHMEEQLVIFLFNFSDW